MMDNISVKIIIPGIDINYLETKVVDIGYSDKILVVESEDLNEIIIENRKEIDRLNILVEKLKNAMRQNGKI